MMPECSRRSFVKLSSGFAIGSAFLSRDVFAGVRKAGKVCNACHALVCKPNMFSRKGAECPYCPNCGVNMATGRQDISSTFPGHLKNNLSVPFPNANLVRETDKPLVSFKSLKFKVGG